MVGSATDLPGVASCAPEDVRAQLSRILMCRDFDASDRNRRFLQYIVEEALQGRAERIKAYSIATSVFGRSETFDPQQDAIVRIEAGRMRRALDHYYLMSGLKDPIRISIPVGSYVPSFSLAQEGGPLDRPLRQNDDDDHAPVHRPTIYVVDFAAEGEGSGLAGFVQGMTRHIIVGLTRFTDLVVVGPGPGSGVGGVSGPESKADFELSGAMMVADGRLFADVLLRDAVTGQYIWTDSFERKIGAAGLAVFRTELADLIVSAIGQPTGVIFSYMARCSLARAQETCKSFESVVRFHNYWRTLDRDMFEPVRLALEQTIQRDPGYAEAYACLSQMYSNSVRFGYEGSAASFHPLRRATTLALRAIQLSPTSSRGYLALAIAYWFNGQVDSAFSALATSRALNPNDMEVAAELGLRHIFRKNWAEGVALIEEAYQRNPALPCTYRIGLSLCHHMHGRHHEALAEAWKIDMPGVIYPLVMVAVSAFRLGRAKDAQSAIKSLLALCPEYGDQVEQDLLRRHLDPEVAAVIVKDLHDAGLPGGAAPTAMLPPFLPRVQRAKVRRLPE